MAIVFDEIPDKKPSQRTQVEPGQYLGTVVKAEMLTGKSSGNEFLSVAFKLEKGGFVNEAFTDNEKPFNQWKIGRLCKACGVSLVGEFQLKDLTKVIKGKEVLLDVTMNDRGYPSIDYSGNNDGMYSTNATALEQAQESDDAEVDAAIADQDDEF